MAFMPEPSKMEHGWAKAKCQATFLFLKKGMPLHSHLKVLNRNPTF